MPLMLAMTVCGSVFALKSDEGSAASNVVSLSCSPRNAIGLPRSRAASRAFTSGGASSPSCWPCAKYGSGPSRGFTSRVVSRASDCLNVPERASAAAEGLD